MVISSLWSRYYGAMRAISMLFLEAGLDLAALLEAILPVQVFVVWLLAKGNAPPYLLSYKPRFVFIQ